MSVDDLTPTRFDQVTGSVAAVALLTKLTEMHGGLMVHQAGGICAGSAPMCHPVGEFRIGRGEKLVGEIVLPAPLPPVLVWVADDLNDRRRHTPLVLDVADGRGSGYSLEAPEGVRFVLTSRILD